MPLYSVPLEAWAGATATAVQSAAASAARGARSLWLVMPPCSGAGPRRETPSGVVGHTREVLGQQPRDDLRLLDVGQVRGIADDLEPRIGDARGDALAVLRRRRRIGAGGDDERRRADAPER